MKLTGTGSLVSDSVHTEYYHRKDLQVLEKNRELPARKYT
jgi:hypothetical protein